MRTTLYRVCYAWNGRESHVSYHALHRLGLSSWKAEHTSVKVETQAVYNRSLSPLATEARPRQHTTQPNISCTLGR